MFIIFDYIKQTKTDIMTTVNFTPDTIEFYNQESQIAEFSLTDGIDKNMHLVNYNLLIQFKIKIERMNEKAKLQDLSAMMRYFSEAIVLACQLDGDLTIYDASRIIRHNYFSL